MLHFVEPVGQGGIHHHVLGLAAIVANAGHAVTVHTATDREHVELPGVNWCECVRWHRKIRSKRARDISIAIDFVLRTLPHLVLATRRSTVHIHGLFRVGLSIATIVCLRATDTDTLFSPHNTFSRRNRRGESIALRLAIRAASSVVVYSLADEQIVRRWGTKVALAPLVMWYPEPPPELIEELRRDLLGTNSGPLVLVPGQIRIDKGIDLAILASALVTQRHVLAVVGEDKGDLARCRSISAEAGVEVAWRVGYIDSVDFAAYLGAADLILAPYRRASQSAVLVMARALGTPTIATDVGGLGELATRTANPDDPVALAFAMDELLSKSAKRDRPLTSLQNIIELYPRIAESSH